MITKEELIDFCTYLEKEGGNDFIDKNELVDIYLKSINSTRRRERRAMGLMSQTENERSESRDASAKCAIKPIVPSIAAVAVLKNKS